MNIVITGATAGIGEQLVNKCCSENNNKVFAFARSKQKLEELTQKIKSKYPECQLVTLDIDFATSREANLLELVSDFPEIDIIVNNAGMMLHKPFNEILESEWQAVYKINVFFPALLVKSLMDKLGKNRKSHIINISSMGGFQGSVKFKGLSVYASSKAALANLTELLAVELEDKNIAVNCLALGAVNTEMLQNAFPGYQAPISANEMADFIYWFSMNGQNYFNGKILPVSLSTP